MSGWGTGWINPSEQATELLKITEKAKEEIINITGLNRLPNKKPTHDPYTNPNAHIYYECKCGAILDPGTKSFAALNNCASEAGWKVRWGAEAYQPYCPKCGEGVE